MEADVQWVKIRQEAAERRPRLSWHVFVTYTRIDDGALTACHRRASASTLSNSVPGGEKTCETCLRHIWK